MDNRFEVYSLDPNNSDVLLALIKSRLVSMGIENNNPRYAPLQSTFDLVVKLKAQCAVLQRFTSDPDFLAEHDAYYARWSLKVPNTCDRIHFFNDKPISVNPLEVIDQMADRENCYLGFITLRPIRMSPVGATILAAPVAEESFFILSKDVFPVNIAGRRFCVTGTPFMQQDNAVGACAQASIWMALRTLRRKEGHAAFTPAEITSAATRFLITGRILPNRGGLIFEQVAEAVRAAGYSPHTLPLKERGTQATSETLRDARLTLYPYVESGIPVLVILEKELREGHAVLLIGHGWKKNPENPKPIGRIDGTLDIFDASEWAQPFYIHNDNTGPYLPLPDFSEKGYSLGDATMAIPFLPADTFIDGGEARLASLNLFANILINLDKYLPPSDADILTTEKINAVVARTYLQDKADFREAALKCDMASEVKTYYRTKWLPKRVWVTEINALNTYSDADAGNGRRIGEIVLDPASEPDDGAFLSIHINADLIPGNKGVIIDRDAFSGEMAAIPIEDDKCTSPLFR